MHCFCMDSLKKDSSATLKLEFANGEMYCREWAISYGLMTVLKFGAPMVITIINLTLCTIFHKLVNFEKRYTLNDQTMSVFIKITYL